MKSVKVLTAILLFLSFSFNATKLLASTPSSSSGNAPKLSYDQIKRAAEKGDPDAEYALGYMYYYGKSGAIKNVVEAKEWIEKAASHNQPQAVKALALMNRQPVRKSSSVEGASSSMKEQEQKVVDERTQKAIEDKGNSYKDEGKMTYVDMRKQQQTLANKPVTASQLQTKPLQESSGGYTLQLLGAFQEEPILEMIERHHLDSAAIYQTTFKDKKWFVLVYGRYETKEDANRMAVKLEQKLDVKPWAKPYSSMKQYKKLSRDVN